MSSETEAVESSNPDKKERQSLLPVAFFSPLNLLWLCVLPLVILLLINAQAVWLAYGEMNGQANQHWALVLLMTNGALILTLTFLALKLKWNGRPLNVLWFLLLIVVFVSFAWMNLRVLEDCLPRTVPSWILDRETLLLSQFACLMPGCFYALLGLACFPSRLSKLKDMLLSGGMLVGIPLFWYMLMLVARQFQHYPDVGPFAVIPVLILSTALMLIGLMRLLIRLHTWLSRYQFALVLIASLVLPLGGLLLNQAIPFPVNLQLTAVYVLTIVNGLVLLGGCLPQSKGRPLAILLQVVMFPFTLYFFVIFLPFLPLFVPAMIVMGAGFLILAPVVLFMVHVQRLLAGYGQLVTRWGKQRSLLAFVAAFAVLPLWFAGQALLDRVVIHQGLDYIYSPQLYPRKNFSGSPQRLGKTLEKLVNFKEGQVLPILSDLYNKVVFDNLFLPDSKMEEMNQAFLGKPLPKAKGNKMDEFAPFGRRSNRQSRSEPRMRPLQLPREQAVIQSVETFNRTDGECIRSTSVLQIKNNAKVQNEFVALISIPEGVLVTNYWLHIGNERVPGKLFEKKTALWVYEQIRDQTRRDPGILRYIGPNTLELRVFPLEAGEVRTTEIEFLSSGSLTELRHPTQYYPPDKTGSLSDYQSNRTSNEIMFIKGYEFFPAPLGGFPKLKPQNFHRTDHPGGCSLIFNGAMDGWPKINQEGYIHFILDHSEGVSWTANEWNTRLREIVASPELAGFSKARITLAHYEGRQLPSGERSLATPLLTEGELDSWKRKGGFVPDKALKEEILAYEAELSRKSADAYPVFIVVSPATKEMHWGDTTPYFLAQGDFPLYEARGADPLRLVKGSRKGLATREVILAEADGSLFVVRPFGSWMGLLKSADEVKLWAADGSSKQIFPKKVSHKLYETGMALWAKEIAQRQNPSLRSSRLADLVYQSKESGILVPATSYIVVENSAQWKILQLKEKQKLAGHEVLELQEASEPAWIILALLLALFLRFRSRLAAYLRGRSVFKLLGSSPTEG